MAWRKNNTVSSVCVFQDRIRSWRWACLEAPLTRETAMSWSRCLRLVRRRQERGKPWNCFRAPRTPSYSTITQQSIASQCYSLCLNIFVLFIFSFIHVVQTACCQTLTPAPQRVRWLINALQAVKEQPNGPHSRIQTESACCPNPPSPACRWRTLNVT